MTTVISYCILELLKVAKHNLLCIEGSDQIKAFKAVSNSVENDLNGDIELARFTQEFRTGTNATESFQITADTFDADQFGTDEDGVKNLAEVTAGTDPLTDEGSQPEVFDFFVLSTWSRMSVLQSLESQLSQERPFFDTFDSTQDEWVSTKGDVDIDAEGNGILTYTHYEGQGSDTSAIA